MTYSIPAVEKKLKDLRNEELDVYVRSFDEATLTAVNE